MGKKKAKQENQVQRNVPIQIYARKLKPSERERYELIKRQYSCLYDKIKGYILVDDIDPINIKAQLAYKCRNIEEQIIKLRQIVSLNNRDLNRRRYVAQQLLDCLSRHHNIVYEGLIFGSSINGLGFKNSDVDLRLRPLVEKERGLLEPMECDRSDVESTLHNIAYQTTRCSPAWGCFAPGRRCPVAKLKFVLGEPKKPLSLKEGINFDVSMLSTNSLGSFNSEYIRFLCYLEPKFHLLAIVLKYWSNMHDLIQPGVLSSYALITMMIFFCQNVSPPLLPTVDEMNNAFFRDQSMREDRDSISDKAILRQEWNCLISLKKESYSTSTNTEPLCLLMLKFFEFYLNFPYSSSIIITTRLGRPVVYDDFKRSTLFNKDFPMKSILNIQDPFDFKHNITWGMSGEFFRKFILTIRISYERLFKELGNFTRPIELDSPKNGDMNSGGPEDIVKKTCRQFEDWGLNAIFVKLTKKETKIR